MAFRNANKEKALSLAALCSSLRYDPKTGHFIRLTDHFMFPAGSIAGTVLDTGYRTIRVGGQRFLAHRLAWFYVYGEWPSEIDHINRDKGDNRLVNMRISNRNLNMLNSGGKKASELGIKNITRKRKSFSVHINTDSGPVYRKTFRCLGIAIKARNLALQSLIGA